MLFVSISRNFMHGGVYCGDRPILHKYANEDVSLGSWFIGLEVEHIDERSMCCGTPPGIYKIFKLRKDFSCASYSDSIHHCPPQQRKKKKGKMHSNSLSFM